MRKLDGLLCLLYMSKALLLLQFSPLSVKFPNNAALVCLLICPTSTFLAFELGGWEHPCMCACHIIHVTCVTSVLCGCALSCLL